jgi:ABC-type uncharacterized transport system permease subunit
MQDLLRRYENFLLMGAVLSYLAAMLYLWGQLFVRADDGSARAERWHARAGQLGRMLLILGAALHLFSLIGQGGLLFTVRAGVAGLFGWMLVVAYLVVGTRLGRDSLGAFVTPVSLIAAFYSLTAAPLHRETRPELLQTQWLPIHVTIIMLAYVALAFAFAASVIYLIQETLLKRKQLKGLWQRLPSLQVADDLIYRATSFGLGMLTLGILTGIAWMTQQPNYSLDSDPKVLFSILSWIPFALYLIARWFLGWRGRRTNLVVVYGFVVLVISFLGAPHVLGGAP